jgi:fumarate reductase subunit C
MSAQFRGTPRGGNGNRRQQFQQQEEMPEDDGLGNLDDTPLEASAEIPPALKLGIGICELAFGFFTNAVQLVTTTMAIIAMIVGASVVAVLNLSDIAHRFGWFTLIGIVIAGAIQLFLHKNAQPMSSTWQRLRHIQNFNIQSTHALRDVQNAITINSIYFVLSLGADVVSDATFVNMFTHNPLVILFWIVFLTGSSTLLLYDGATRFWGAVEDYKDYKAYHQQYNEG